MVGCGILLDLSDKGWFEILRIGVCDEEDEMWMGVD